MDQRKQNVSLLIIFAFMLSLLPEICFSLGFGQIKLYSYLNEPLDAEIELQGAEDIDTSHLIVSLASVEDFKRIELARPYFLSKLRFEVVQKNKQTFLKVTSEDPVKQPYLEFLVVMTWPEGRVVRDYTLLLDPAPFGGVSKRAANEQALEMLNKADLGDMEPAVSTIPFQDPEAVHALQEKQTKPENSIPPTEIAEAKNPVAIQDTPSNLIVDNKKPVFIEPPKTNQAQDQIPTTQSKPKISRNQILLGSGLALLLAVALTAWFVRRARSHFRVASVNSINIVEDVVMFDEEINLKLDLANQYLAIQDIQNAETILEEIISRGNSAEIKLAKELLKKINRL